MGKVKARWRAGVSACAIACLGHVACAQCLDVGPNLIVGDVVGVANYTASGDLEALMFGANLCNVGDAPLNFVVSDDHPVVAANLFRVITRGDGSTAIEQVGMSWVYHTFVPLQQNLCCTACVMTSSTTLGAHCSSPESASIMGSQPALAPRWRTNASNGTNNWPATNPPYTGSTARRIQVAITDLAPSTSTNAYVGELLTLSAHESSLGHRFDNASSRLVMVAGSGSAWNFSLAGAAARAVPAISAWRDRDPLVTQSEVILANSSAGGPPGGEAMFIVSSRATELPGGTWHYEYAAYNMNSDRGARSFRVPLPAGASVTNIGFHDVVYRDGDGINNVTVDGTDWVALRSGDAIEWSTPAYDANPNTNALRWGTLYNFRFDADVPPRLATVSMSMFKPAAGDAPSELSAVAQVPEIRECAPCPADYDQDGGVTGGDVGAFFNDFEQGLACADVDEDGGVTGGDVAAFFAVYEAGGC